MDSRRFYELIGMFCVQFEQACLSMEDCVAEIQTKEGLSKADIEKKLAGFTPDALQKHLKSLLIARFNCDKYSQTIELAFSEISNLVKRRNLLIHSKWVPPIDDKAWSKSDGLVLGKNAKPNKNGEDSLYLSLSEEILEMDIKQCYRAQKMLNSFFFLLAFPDMLGRHFEIIDSKLQLYPNA